MATAADSLAMALRVHSEGNLDLAEQYTWAVLQVEPNHADALHLLALTAYQKGNMGSAIDYLKRSLICNGYNPVSWKNLGDFFLVIGKTQEGITYYEHALRLQPNFADALNNLGTAYQSLENWEKAVDYHRQAIVLMPDFSQAYNNLGNALRGQGKQAEALAAFEQSLALQPDSPQITYNIGTTLHEQGEHEKAIGFYRQALLLKPEYPDASNNLATALKEQGYLDQAVAQFRETLRLNPDHVLAYYNLSELAAAGAYRFSANELDHVKNLLACERFSPLERSLCGFSIASVLNRQGSYDEAFSYYQVANDIRKRLLQDRHEDFDLRKQEMLVDELMGTYDRAYFEKVKNWGIDADAPIFILGMPRSGSTLVEQILASHPQVFGAGEVGEVPLFIMQFGEMAHANSKGNAPLPNEGVTKNMALDYSRRINQLGQGAKRVTIKTLDNFMYLGIIATLFPKARIIHCRRDPLDICLSCYFQNFKSVDFTWSLDDVGAYYRTYEKLMTHWKRVLPTPMVEVCYEDLIHNQESVTRAMLAWCGLDWDEHCLSFFETRRVVRTASNVQVRKPITADSIGRWKHYRSHLGPLFKALGMPEREMLLGGDDDASLRSRRDKGHNSLMLAI